MEKTAQYTVRNYVKGDEVVLAKIFSECFEPITPRRLIEYIKRDDVHPEDVFVGIVDGKPVSHVNIAFKELHHGEGVYIKTAGVAGVCTDSSHRKKGILTNLMKLCLDHAQQKGVSNASLFTGLDIPAHRIYQRLGFVDILTWRGYIKYIDYPSVFARWLRQLNRLLKYSKIAARKLEGWEKSITVQLEEVGNLSFRFREKRFQRLRKPPKRADIEFSTDLQTYSKIMWGIVQWEESVQEGKLRVKRGELVDIEMLKRILNWRWDD